MTGRALEHIDARSWIERWCGRSVYQKLWSPLFDFKFHQYAGNISANWIRTRIRRVGSFTPLADAGGAWLYRRRLKDAGGCPGRGHQDARWGNPLKRTGSPRGWWRNGGVVGVETAKGSYPADAVISTIPTPLVSRLVDELSSTQKAAYQAIMNIAVVCVVVKLRQSVSGPLLDQCQ